MTGNEQTSKQEETFKEQLDKKAVAPEPSHQNPVVEKITEYIPGASKILGGTEQAEPETNNNQPKGPPERPDHDDKIEEFVRDQHRSMGEDGTPKTL